MSLGRIHKLLSGEYSEFDDVVLLDTPFVEITKYRKGIRQAYVGMTCENFIVAIERPVDCRHFPHVYSDTKTADPYTDGVDLQWVVPLCFVRLLSKTAYCLNVECEGKKTRYFELNTHVGRDIVWGQWLDRMNLLKHDSLGIKRELRLKFGCATKADLAYAALQRQVQKIVPDAERNRQSTKTGNESLVRSFSNRVTSYNATTKKVVQHQSETNETLASILKPSQRHVRNLSRDKKEHHHVKFEKSAKKKTKRKWK